MLPGYDMPALRARTESLPMGEGKGSEVQSSARAKWPNPSADSVRPRVKSCPPPSPLRTRDAKTQVVMLLGCTGAAPDIRHQAVFLAVPIAPARHTPGREDDRLRPLPNIAALVEGTVVAR